MPKPTDKLARSLELLRRLQDEGKIALASSCFPETDRIRLERSGFILRIMKGGYIAQSPDTQPGESTPWYTAYWTFCSQYLEARFGSMWCLSPAHSLLIHAGNWSVPNQLTVRAPRGRNKPTTFPHETSILELRIEIPSNNELQVVHGMRVYPLESALCRVSPSFFSNHAAEVRTVLSLLTDASMLLSLLLERGHTRAAGRIAGGLRSIGKDRIADDIMSTMQTALHDVREINPFVQTILFRAPSIPQSAYVHRIQILWETMRQDVMERCQHSTRVAPDPTMYLQTVEDIFSTDAYHSLSIEGYQVSTTLIERIKSGNWAPDEDESDRQYRDRLAARGYWQAFQKVKESVRLVLGGVDVGSLLEDHHGVWYRELFGPGVTAGLIPPASLAGYRTGQVFIRNSQHVPLHPAAVRDTMPALFHLISEEPEPAVRIVLGHFFFVYIHPYMDGNGRMARFLMNVLMASGGLPWTIIKVEDRTRYMISLEQASVGHDIVPFTTFISDTISASENPS